VPVFIFSHHHFPILFSVMEDLFKKFVNAGVGFVSLTTDRVQKTIDTLVKESKLSEKEGAKIMDELKKNGETKRKELEKQVQGLAAKMMKTVGVAPNSDVEELKRTVKGGSKSTLASGGGVKNGATKPAAKAPASKTASAAKGAAASATSKAASTVKKAADKTSATASKTQKSAAGSAGAAKKDENKATGAGASSSNANS
jgi:polyhydroxyalkanoate synthesis regulator phasin